MVAAGMRALAYSNAFITGGLGKGDKPGGRPNVFLRLTYLWEICLN